MTIEEKLKRFIEETSYIYDLNDTPEWLYYHRKEVLQILLEENNEELPSENIEV